MSELGRLSPYGFFILEALSTGPTHGIGIVEYVEKVYRVQLIPGPLYAALAQLEAPPDRSVTGRGPATTVSDHIARPGYFVPVSGSCSGESSGVTPGDAGQQDNERSRLDTQPRNVVRRTGTNRRIAPQMKRHLIIAGIACVIGLGSGLLLYALFAALTTHSTGATATPADPYATLPLARLSIPMLRTTRRATTPPRTTSSAPASRRIIRLISRPGARRITLPATARSRQPPSTCSVSRVRRLSPCSL